MFLPFWGELQKSQIDPEKIEEAIQRLLNAHNEDPDAHLGPGGSLYSHKASTVIDHIAESIIEDKIKYKVITPTRIHSSGLVADAIVAPEGGDYDNVQDALNAGHRIIYIKRGVYEIDSPITILDSNIKIIGEDRLNTIFIPKAGSGFTGPCFLIGGYYAPDIPDIENVEISNLTIGQPDKQFEDGIWLGTNINEYFSLRYIYLNKLRFYVAGDAGIAADFTYNLFVYDNEFYGFSGEGAVNVSSSGAVYIMNNVFYDSLNANVIEISGGGAFYAGYFILNNLVIFSDSATEGTGILIYYGGGVCANNVILNCNDAGIWAESCESMVFEGNIIQMVGGNTGFHLGFSNYCRVVNNCVIGSGYGSGIWLHYANYSLVLGNTLKGCITGFGLDHSSYNSIISNYIRENTTGANLQSGSYNYFRLNYCCGNTTNYQNTASNTIVAASTTNDNLI
jgi:parallel beta-helix repeat protein